jgi:hypothetical protein
MAPKWSRRTIVGGYVVFLVGYVVLVASFGYNRFPCYYGGPCLDIPNPIPQIAPLLLVLATLPLVTIFEFRPAVRIGGAVAVLGALVLIFGTLFLWDRWFTFGETSVQILTTSPTWVPVLKLGGVVIGSVLMILGCAASPRPRVTPTASPTKTRGTAPAEAPKA